MVKTLRMMILLGKLISLTKQWRKARHRSKKETKKKRKKSKRLKRKKMMSNMLSLQEKDSIGTMSVMQLETLFDKFEIKYI